MEFNSISISQLSSSSSSTAPSSSAVARFSVESGVSQLQFHQESESSDVIHFNLRTSQLFKLSPVKSMCVSEGSETSRKDEKSHSTAISIVFRTEDISETFHCTFKQWKNKLAGEGSGMALRDKFRASWSNPSLKKLFIDLCIEEASRGGRSGGTLKIQSWNRIMTELKNKMSIDLTQRQLKNQWDYMKRQYTIWAKLTTGTGHGYNAITQIFDWPNDRWDDFLKMYPEAKQYRHKPLMFANELQILFECTLATGEVAWGPPGEGMPMDSGASSTQPNVDLSQNDLFNLTEGTPTLDTPNFSSTLQGNEEGQSREKRRKKTEWVDLQNSMDALIDVLGKDSDSGPSIKECLKSLNEMSILEKGDRLYINALNVFVRGKEYRTMWMALKDPGVRLSWLTSFSDDCL